MQTKTIVSSEILNAYDVVSTLYPHIPSLSHWRAWEYAVYQHYQIDGRILDIGCGDGRYFQLIWPQATDVIGVDMDPGVAALGRASGVYRNVYAVNAHQIPEFDASFDHVFANCSLEHMDHLDGVLAEIQRCLKPGGTLLCSVVTDRFIQWSLLPLFIALAGFDDVATTFQGDFRDYHHLTNPLSVAGWENKFNQAGLAAEDHVPILPRYNSGLFLLMDSLWHVKKTGGGEFGDLIHPFLSDNPKFPSAFRHVLAGLLEMETDWQDCSGAIFLVRKPRS